MLMYPLRYCIQYAYCNIVYAHGKHGKWQQTCDSVAFVTFHTECLHSWMWQGCIEHIFLGGGGGGGRGAVCDITTSRAGVLIQ